MRCILIQLSLPITVVKRSRTQLSICKSFWGNHSQSLSILSLNLPAILPGRTLLVSSIRENSWSQETTGASTAGANTVVLVSTTTSVRDVLPLTLRVTSTKTSNWTGTSAIMECIKCLIRRLLSLLWSLNKSSMLSAKLTSMLRNCEKQAEGMTDIAAQNLALKIRAVKEKKRKAAEALAERKAKKNNK